MEKLREYSIGEILDELISRVENDRDDYIEYLQTLNKEQLDKIKGLLLSGNKFEQLTFSTNNYAGVSIDRAILDKTDKGVMCSRLIYYVKAKGIKTKDLSRITVFEARQLLGQTKINKGSRAEKNALISVVDHFGVKDALDIKDSINFYEQQVVRQSMERPSFKGNLFTLNEDKKYSIVEKDYPEIIEYLVNNSLICVWGNMTQTRKEDLIRSIRGRGFASMTTRQRITRAIADYTTLSELREGIIKTKTIDRFITKKM